MNNNIDYQQLRIDDLKKKGVYGLALTEYKGTTEKNFNLYPIIDLEYLNIMLSYTGCGCQLCNPSYDESFSKDELVDVVKDKLIKRKQRYYRVVKMGIEKRKSYAVKRLMRDLKEINQSELDSVFALPLENNIFEWHVNLLGTSKYKYGCFHLSFHFNEDYPHKPPKVKMLTPISHSHVYDEWICLDLLETHTSSERYHGWTSAYSVMSICLQLQSFLFEEESKRKKSNTIFVDIKKSLNYKCKGCKHNMCNGKVFPWNPKWEECKVFYKKGCAKLRNQSKLLVEWRKEFIKEKSKKKFKMMKIMNEKRSKTQEKCSKTQEKCSKTISRERTEIKNGTIFDLFDKNYLKEIELTKVIPEMLTKIRLLSERSKSRKRMKKRYKRLQSQLERIENLKINYKREYTVWKSKKLNEKIRGKLREEKVVNISILPNEILISIFEFLRQSDLIIASKVSKQWDLCSSHPYLWNLLSETSLICFFSKRSFTEDTIGVGINFKYSRSTGKILEVTSELDLLSYSSFKEEFVRHNVWKKPFTHFLPLYINATHWKKGCSIFNGLIKEVYNVYRKSDIEICAIDLLSKLMNSMIVVIMKGNTYASEKALQGYCYFHRMLIEYSMRNENLTKSVNSIVKRFIDNERSRHKTVIPSLGEFIPLIAFSKYCWNDFKDSFIDEVFQRNSFWINKKSGVDLSYLRNVKIDEIVGKSFKAVAVSLKLVMFHMTFLNGINPNSEEKDNKAIAEEYDGRTGYAPLKMKLILQNEIFDILKIKSFDSFFKFVNVSVTNPFNYLKDSWNRASSRGYFGYIDTSGPILKPNNLITKKQQKKRKALATIDRNRSESYYLRNNRRYYGSDDPHKQLVLQRRKDNQRNHYSSNKYKGSRGQRKRKLYK